MTLITNLIVKIFILLLIGWGAAKLKVVGEETQEHLSNVLVNISLPASMLASSQSEFSMSNLQGIGVIGAMTLVMYLICFAAGIIFQCVKKGDKTKQSIMLLIIAFANTGFLGIPIVTEMVGATGTLYSVIYNIVFDLLYFSIGLYMIQSSKNESKNGIDWKTLLGNHMIWISVIVIILYVVPFRFPAAITESFSLLGSMMMPVSMLVMGIQLSSIKIREVLLRKDALILTITRMLLVPVLTMLAMILIRPAREIAYTMVILSAMPSASLNAIIASKYKAYPELATITVTQSTVVFIGVFPIVCYLLTYFFR